MSKVHWRGVYRGARVLVALLCDGYEGSLPRWRVCFPDWVGAGVEERRAMAGASRPAVEQHGEDRLIGGAGRQVYLDLGFQFDDTGGEFD